MASITPSFLLSFAHSGTTSPTFRPNRDKTGPPSPVSIQKQGPYFPFISLTGAIFVSVFAFFLHFRNRIPHCPRCDSPILIQNMCSSPVSGQLPPNAIQVHTSRLRPCVHILRYSLLIFTSDAAHPSSYSVQKNLPGPVYTGLIRPMNK